MSTPMESHAPPIQLNLTTSVDYLGTDLGLRARTALFAQALAEGTPGLRVYRTEAMAVRLSASELLERLAFSAIGFSHRVDERTLIIHGQGFFVSIEASGRREQCACRTCLWADGPDRAAQVQGAISALTGEHQVTEPMRYIVDWRYLNSQGNINRGFFEQVVREELLDEAYPGVPGGISVFISRYLEASESVLLLQGPPGTGKTRLIRALLGAMSARKGSPATAVYTSETAIFEKDEFYMNFITGEHDALVVEDADLLLSARADGNRVMHRFLNIADGIVQGQDRKIIFSTNLRGTQSIDEALVRPGRCFAHLPIRELTLPEARRLLERLCGGDAARAEEAMREFGGGGKVSLARVYAALRSGERTDTGLAGDAPMALAS